MAGYLKNNKIQLMILDNSYIFKNPYSDKYGYVSMGDSIAAGHSINSDWENNYGTGSQYGENGNMSTEIVPGSYTDRIGDRLIETYGKGRTNIVSFAHSGDENKDLIDHLYKPEVIKTIQKANIITICIGANTILSPATKEIPNFIAYGNPTLLELNNTLESGFTLLAADKNTRGSYRNIFNRLAELNTNPNTKFVFTTIYNPYKYLWLDKSTDGNDYIDGYFGPIFWAVPNVEADIPLVGQMDVRKFVYETAYLKFITERINDPAGDGSYSLAEWVEEKIVRLNSILTQAISEFGDSRFIVADTKSVFESYPDRHVRENCNYSDIVNVEIVKGQTVEDLDWGQFWDNWSIDSLSNIASSIADTIINKVILPDTDPHPEEEGQYALYRSFADALGWESLNRYTITFNANGGSGTMATQKVVATGRNKNGNNIVAYAPLNPVTFTPATGYRFVGWNTKADGTGAAYAHGQAIPVTSDITLYAQWSNTYYINFKHTNHTNGVYGPNETGHKECYALFINGVEQPDFGTFAEGSSRIIPTTYGATIRVVVSNYNPTELTYDDVDCDVYFNGANVASGYRGTEYTFTLTSDVTIDFRWKIAGSLVTFNAQSWEDCYITTH